MTDEGSTLFLELAREAEGQAAIRAKNADSPQWRRTGRICACSSWAVARGRSRISSAGCSA
jgi:hypothetical protein